MTTTAMGPTTALASRMMRVMVVEDHELMREAHGSLVSCTV